MFFSFVCLPSKIFPLVLIRDIMSITFANDHVTCVVRLIRNDAIQIEGEIKDASSYVETEVLAPHPIDRRTSYHGSGLPFPCPGMALENTPNRTVPDTNGKFQAVFSYPNSYYTHDGRTKVKPSIFFRLLKQKRQEPVIIRFELPEHTELLMRTLTHRVGRANGPWFYGAKDFLLDPLPRSAEHVMRTLKQYKGSHDIAV